MTAPKLKTCSFNKWNVEDLSKFYFNEFFDSIKYNTNLLMADKFKKKYTFSKKQ